MKKESVAEFINENYKKGEIIFWQTISKSDIEAFDYEERKISDARWKAFVKNAEYYGHLADRISELVAEEFAEFVYEPEGDVA